MAMRKIQLGLLILRVTLIQLQDGQRRRSDIGAGDLGQGEKDFSPESWPCTKPKTSKAVTRQ
jgi:hypothetical protein